MDCSNKNKHMPDFFVLGTAKSGTTSLYHYLRQHPQVVKSTSKEPSFFAFQNSNLSLLKGPEVIPFVTQLGDYEAIYSSTDPLMKKGGFSWRHLYYPQSCYKIKRYAPGAKLIAILRNPVERAYSHFKMLLYSGRETTLSFQKALELEKDRIKHHWEADWHYLNVGLYFEQLKKYYALFDKNQIKVFLFEDLVKDPNELCQQIFNFIEVPPFSVNTTKQYSFAPAISENFLKIALTELYLKTKIEKHGSLDEKMGLFDSFLLRKRLVQPCFLRSQRKKVSLFFREDILKLQELIGRDLSHWI